MKYQTLKPSDLKDFNEKRRRFRLPSLLVLDRGVEQEPDTQTPHEMEVCGHIVRRCNQKCNQNAGYLLSQFFRSIGLRKSLYRSLTEWKMYFSERDIPDFSTFFSVSFKVHIRSATWKSLYCHGNTFLTSKSLDSVAKTELRMRVSSRWPLS